MTTVTETTRPAAPIDDLLASLRARIRRYVWIEAVALAMAALGLAFWFSLAVDYSFEPPTSVRVVLLLLYALAATYLIAQILVARLRMPLTDRSMAILLERRFPYFGDSLVTSVEMAGQADQTAGLNREMLDYTRDRAIDQLDQVDLEKIFNPQPLARGVIAGVVLTASVLAFQTTVPDAFGLWMRRSVLLSNELWPRKTQLALEGFATEYGIVVDDRETELHVFAGNVRVDRDAPKQETAHLAANQAGRFSLASGTANGKVFDADQRRFALQFSPSRLAGHTRSQQPPAVGEAPLTSDASHDTAGIATLSYTKDCLWGEDAAALETGSRVSAGTFHLAEGLAELSFDCGARIVMEGPAEVELESADGVRVISGKVLASVPRQAQGFRVGTPAARLTDQGNDETTVAKGSDLELVVNADTEKVVPRVVEVRFETAEGGRERRRMQREGNAEAGKDEQQRYRHTFARVNSAIQFDVVGGDDDRLRDLRVDVVDSPTMIDPVLHCEYPPYMRRSPEELPVTGAMLIPFGTHVVYRAAATKELLGVRIDQQGGEEQATHELTFTEGGSEARQVKFDLGPLVEEQTLLFQLLDMDGITSRDAIRLTLFPARDDAPAVDVKTRGIGSAITAKARIPFTGEINDDYGIARCWFEYNTDDQPVRETNLTGNPNQAVVQAVDERFDVSVLELKPGQKLSLSVKAADNFNLAEAPNVGSSERLVMDVVSDEQLRARLEARELNLRRRFESIIEEVTDTRDSLDRVALELPTSPASDETNEEESNAEEETGKPAGEVDRDSVDEKSAEKNTPVDSDEEGADADHDERTRALALDQLRIQRAVQNSRKNSEETGGVKASFEDILEELINNGIDSEELRARLHDGIAEPLGTIVDDGFGGLDKQLTDLQTKLNRLAALQHSVKAGDAAADDRAAAVEEARDVLITARLQSDEVLVDMQAVLDKMLELETFNEVLDLLRGIIESQKDVSEATKERRKQKLRELLED